MDFLTELFASPRKHKSAGAELNWNALGAPASSAARVTMIKRQTRKKRSREMLEKAAR